MCFNALEEGVRNKKVLFTGGSKFTILRAKQYTNLCIFDFSAVKLRCLVIKWGDLGGGDYDARTLY